MPRHQVHLRWEPSVNRRSFMTKRDGDNAFHKCKQDKECSDGRICTEIGWCRRPKDVTSRPKCNNDIDCPEGKICAASGYCILPKLIPNEELDEAKNKFGPNRCIYDKECNKDRICDPENKCIFKEDAPKDQKRCTSSTKCPEYVPCDANGWCQSQNNFCDSDEYCADDQFCSSNKKCVKKSSYQPRLDPANSKICNSNAPSDSPCPDGYVCGAENYCIKNDGLKKCWGISLFCNHGQFCALSGYCVDVPPERNIARP